MIARLLQSLILLYKRTFSAPLLSTCRFTPTCSDYAMEALERHGAFFGGLLTLWRVARCNPFMRGGLDTVPMKLRSQHLRTHTCHVGDGKNQVPTGEREVSTVPPERSSEGEVACDGTLDLAPEPCN